MPSNYLSTYLLLLWEHKWVLGTFQLFHQAYLSNVIYFLIGSHISFYFCGISHGLLLAGQLEFIMNPLECLRGLVHVLEEHINLVLAWWLCPKPNHHEYTWVTVNIHIELEKLITNKSAPQDGLMQIMFGRN